MLDKDKPELWPSLFEKAFAKAEGGYAKIEGGATPDGDALGILSGGDSLFISLSNIDEDTFFADLQGAKDDGSAITVGMASPNKDEETAGTSDRVKLAKQLNVHFDHAYTLMDFDAKAKTVTLRNPWGFSDPTGPLTFAQLRLLADGFHMGGTR